MLDSHGPSTVERLPIPDPTVLTTAALDREIRHLQELLEGRLDAKDKATILSAEHAEYRLKTLEVENEVHRTSLLGLLPRQDFDTILSEWHHWRADIDRHVAGVLISRSDFEIQIKRSEELVAKAEQVLIERVAMALEGHRQLHVAHDEAHQTVHASTDLALVRADQTTRETAALHALAHEREHTMTKEASEKAEAAANVRFDLLTAAMNRTDLASGGFVSRIEVLDKIEAVVARLDVLDKQSALTADRISSISTNASRIDHLEREQALLAGRDKGIGISWAIVVAAVAVTATIVGLLFRVV